MLRIMLLPLLLFTISMACMGQTFQYSRGWTNGKRSLGLTQQQQRYLQHEINNISPDLYDDQVLDRYFVQMPRYLRNAILGRNALYNGVLSLKPTTVSNVNSNGNEPTSARNNVDSNNNNLFGSHHQSNELFDELSGAMEPTDYGKH